MQEATQDTHTLETTCFSYCCRLLHFVGNCAGLSCQCAAVDKVVSCTKHHHSAWMEMNQAAEADDG